MERIANVIAKDINGKTDTAIQSINYNIDQQLKIEVYSLGGNVNVIFKNVIGFRVLDEGDLLDFWPEFSSPNGWLYEVSSGGWKELESRRSGFMSGDRKGIREFFLTASDECVSVFCFETPVIEFVERSDK